MENCDLTNLTIKNDGKLQKLISTSTERYGYESNPTLAS